DRARLPVAARDSSLPAREGRPAGVPVRAECVGPGAAAADDRDHGELPAAGRLDRGAGGAATVHGWARGDRGRPVECAAVRGRGWASLAAILLAGMLVGCGAVTGAPAEVPAA